MNYYEVLGVGQDASQDDISKAYRKIALESHPDVVKDDPDKTERFKKAAEAYGVLSDLDKKADYDRRLHNRMHFRTPFGEDVFQNIFRTTVRRDEVLRGRSLRISVSITLEEVSTGCEKTVMVARSHCCETCNGDKATDWTTCPKCDGAGVVEAVQHGWSLRAECSVCNGRGKTPKNICPDCNGEGFVTEEKKEEVTVNIPAGVTEGAQVRIQGGGGRGPKGTPNGDLYIVIKVQPHKHLKRDGLNLFGEVSVTYTELVLGTTKTCQLLNEEVEVKVPPRTHPGKRLRLKKKGLPSLERTGVVGDAYIQVDLVLPAKLSKEYKAALDKLAELEKQ